MASIPGTNLFNESNLHVTNYGSSYSETSIPMPASLINEHRRLIFTLDASAKDLEEAITHCRDLVVLTDECSEERRWLVRHLVDLRYALKELQDPCDNPVVKIVVGHHFIVHQKNVSLHSAPKRHHCDHCTEIIWNMLQQSYICTDCEFIVHQKCVHSVLRVCAHVTISERQYPIIEMCPEIGLAEQNYKCAECKVMLSFKNTWIEPRICDYNGHYYCPSCHWNDTSIIPARIIHNWDFTPRKVSRTSLQEINLFRKKPLIKLEISNQKLFLFLLKLREIKNLRQKLVYMRKYLSECRHALEEKFLEKQIGFHRHLIQSTDYYSINDMEQVESGKLKEFLIKVSVQCEQHIRNCDICIGKAYICEICSNCEEIFPFDDGCILCDKCNSIYHRACHSRKMTVCPKCVRIKERKFNQENYNVLGVDNVE